MGTIVNAITVILGGLLGLVVRKGLPKGVEEMAMKMLGVSVFIVGIEGVLSAMMRSDSTGALTSSGTLLLIASMSIGGTLGQIWDIDGKLQRTGEQVEKRLGSEGFSKGFISAALIFCVGAMAIVGSLQDGLQGDPSILYVKAALDGVCALILASTLGYGVVFSFLPVLVYQGSITLLAGFLAPIASEALLQNWAMVGYAIVMCIGLNFLRAVNIPTANLLPALLVPVVYEFGTYVWDTIVG